MEWYLFDARSLGKPIVPGALIKVDQAQLVEDMLDLAVELETLHGTPESAARVAARAAEIRAGR